MTSAVVPATLAKLTLALAEAVLDLNALQAGLASEAPSASDRTRRLGEDVGGRERNRKHLAWRESLARRVLVAYRRLASKA